MSGTEDRDTKTNQQVTVSTGPTGFSNLDFDFSFRPLPWEGVTFWEGLKRVFSLLGGIYHGNMTVIAPLQLVNKRYSQTKHFKFLTQQS